MHVFLSIVVLMALVWTETPAWNSGA